MAATWSSQQKAKSADGAVPRDSGANTHEEGLLRVLKNEQRQLRKVLHQKKGQSSPTARLTTRPTHLLYKSKTTQKK
eukprot:4060796-Ditylum_brightwellii.AAC.1